MKILAHFRGGLGNQCFGYAAARALALRTGAELSFSTDILKVDRIYKRTFSLGNFRIAGTLRPDSPTPICHWKRFRYKAIGALTDRLPHLRLDTPPYRFSELPTRWCGTLSLDGYWQSERYFEDFASQIAEELSPTADPLSPDDPIAMRIRSVENSIFLHARSYTDIPGKQDYSNALPVRYYENALAKLREQVPVGTVFLFSDDLAWATNRLSPLIRTTGYECVPVTPCADPSGLSVSLRDFLLMRLCRHGILADSSFSWWAGWLGERLHPEGALRLHVDRATMNADYWPKRWIAIRP